MSVNKKIIRLIFTSIIIIQLIIMAILYFQKQIDKIDINIAILFIKLFSIIVIMFLLSIIIYIFENKASSNGLEETDEYNIQANFDIDLKNKDILYLATIFYKKQPEKRELILLIMQLINKRIIDLSFYLDGNNYKYIIEKRNLHFNNITEIEQELLNYIFIDSNRVDLIKKIDEIYTKNNSKNIIKKMKDYITKFVEIQKSSMKKIYQIITTIIAILTIFLGFSMLILVSSIQEYHYTNSLSIVGIILLYSLIIVIIAFIMTLILKKINRKYKYDNDWYLWLSKNFIFLNILLIISFMFKKFYLIQFIILIIYIFVTLTIIIMYNEHICLYQKDIEIRNRLFSLKKYFKEMQYLRDKEFGNIITYEECLMYGFLFNITIKINNEFDMLQKQLFDVLKKESKLYMELFKTNVLK